MAKHPEEEPGPTRLIDLKEFHGDFSWNEKHLLKTIIQTKREYRVEDPSTWPLITSQYFLRFEGQLYKGHNPLPPGIVAFDDCLMQRFINSRKPKSEKHIKVRHHGALHEVHRDFLRFPFYFAENGQKRDKFEISTEELESYKEMGKRVPTASLTSPTPTHPQLGTSTTQPCPVTSTTPARSGPQLPMTPSTSTAISRPEAAQAQGTSHQRSQDRSTEHAPLQPPSGSASATTPPPSGSRSTAFHADLPHSPSGSPRCQRTRPPPPRTNHQLLHMPPTRTQPAATAPPQAPQESVTSDGVDSREVVELKNQAQKAESDALDMAKKQAAYLHETRNMVYEREKEKEKEKAEKIAQAFEKQFNDKVEEIRELRSQFSIQTRESKQKQMEHDTEMTQQRLSLNATITAQKEESEIKIRQLQERIAADGTTTARLEQENTELKVKLAAEKKDALQARLNFAQSFQGFHDPAWPYMNEESKKRRASNEPVEEGVAGTFMREIRAKSRRSDRPET